MVFDDLRIHLCGRLESQRTRICDRRHGCAFTRRTDEANRRAASFSRSRETAAGARHALGLLRFFTVSDYLVRQSSGRDRLVSQTHTRRLGRAYHHDRNTPFRGAILVPVIAEYQTQSAQAGRDCGSDSCDAYGGSFVDAGARVSGPQMDLPRRGLVRCFWWFVAGVLYLAVGQTIVDSD